MYPVQWNTLNRHTLGLRVLSVISVFHFNGKDTHDSLLLLPFSAGTHSFRQSESLGMGKGSKNDSGT